MKKIFALALAALMTASMATVAFAATNGDGKIDGVQVGVAPSTASTDFETAEAQKKVYKLSSSRAENVVDGSDNGVTVDGSAAANFKGGDRLAVPLVVWDDEASSADGEFDLNDDSVQWFTKDVDHKKGTIKADWKVGEADVTVELVKFTKAVDKIPAGTYVYCAVITLPENNGNKSVDLAGSIKAGTNSSSAKKGYEMAIELSYMPNADDGYTSKDFAGGSLNDKTGIVKFDKDAGEIDIDFDTNSKTVATFTVDVDGQDKLNMEWNTTFDTDFGKKYDYANLEFITFKGEPSFNKTGSLFIYAEDKNTFVYEATEDGAKAVKAEWNEDYEAWEIKTRKLTSYVLSDVELDKQTVTEDKNESSKPDGDKANPDTGR